METHSRRHAVIRANRRLRRLRRIRRTLADRQAQQQEPGGAGGRSWRPAHLQKGTPSTSRASTGTCPPARDGAVQRRRAYRWQRGGQARGRRPAGRRGRVARGVGRSLRALTRIPFGRPTRSNIPRQW